MLVGDLILREVLQGARNEAHAGRIAGALAAFPSVSILSPDLAIEAAANYRRLRAVGITVRKSMDIAIGAFCLVNGHVLLHNDRDFEGMRRHLGLRTLAA